MADRKNISNKLRFEIFKRDSFKCQYCGKSAPDVILNVDHINPVAKGGKNDILNLITACFDCNSGKSDRKLSDNSSVTLQKKQLDDLNERGNQLNMLIEWKTILEDKSFEVDSVLSFFNNKFDSFITLTDFGKRELIVLIKKYSMENILDCINTAYEKYFGLNTIGEIWEKIPRLLNFETASHNDKNKMKFFGGIKGRFDGTSGYNQWKIINTNRIIRLLYEFIDGGETMLTYSDLFKILNSNSRYIDFSDDIDNLYEEMIKIL